MMILSINKQINGFLLSPIRLLSTNYWAFNGPFQRLPFHSPVISRV